MIVEGLVWGVLVSVVLIPILVRPDYDPILSTQIFTFFNVLGFSIFVKYGHKDIK